MTEIELLIDFHKDADRQGPGSDKDTLRALDFMNLPEGVSLKVADIGCGTGAQTLHLAWHLKGEILAVDLFPEFLEVLNARAKAAGLEDQITTLAASMEQLPFDKESFDVIWSEGAIYSMGFEVGVKSWQRFLKPGGYLAVSDITWISSTRPKAIEHFWQKEYPEIDTASGKMRILENNGYRPVGYFILSPESWLEHYYQPMEARFAPYLERHKNSAIAKTIVTEHQEEIKLYRANKDFYSYGFYVAEKPA